MSLDISELEAASAFWENAGYVATSIVVIGVIGESIADLTTWIKDQHRKHVVERISVLLLIAGLAAEILTQVESNNKNSLIVGILNERAGNAEKEAETARKETALLQKVTAWRKIDDEQAAKIRGALAGKDAACRLLILNRTDPESSQLLMKIVGFFNKIDGANCRVFFVDPARPYPFPLPPTGVLSFVSDDAPENEKVFIEAFKEAGVVTGRVGIVGSQLFPPGVHSGLIIAAKPDALETFPWSTMSPQ